MHLRGRQQQRPGGKRPGGKGDDGVGGVGVCTGVLGFTAALPRGVWGVAAGRREARSALGTPGRMRGSERRERPEPDRCSLELTVRKELRSRRRGAGCDRGAPSHCFTSGAGQCAARTT